MFPGLPTHRAGLRHGDAIDGCHLGPDAPKPLYAMFFEC